MPAYHALDFTRAPSAKGRRHPPPCQPAYHTIPDRAPRARPATYPERSPRRMNAALAPAPARPRPVRTPGARHDCSFHGLPHAFRRRRTCARRPPFHAFRRRRAPATRLPCQLDACFLYAIRLDRGPPARPVLSQLGSEGFAAQHKWEWQALRAVPCMRIIILPTSTSYPTIYGKGHFPQDISFPMSGQCKGR